MLRSYKWLLHTVGIGETPVQLWSLDLINALVAKLAGRARLRIWFLWVRLPPSVQNAEVAKLVVRAELRPPYPKGFCGFDSHLLYKTAWISGKWRSLIRTEK